MAQAKVGDWVCPHCGSNGRVTRVWNIARVSYDDFMFADFDNTGEHTPNFNDLMNRMQCDWEPVEDYQCDHCDKYFSEPLKATAHDLCEFEVKRQRKSKSRK